MANTYPNNFEAKVGFNQIRELLKSNCLSSLAKDRVDEMAFLTDHSKIYYELSITEEFLALIRETNNFPTDFYFDLRGAFAKIKTEGRFLELEELFDLKRSLETISEIVRFIDDLDADLFPLLRKLANELQLFPFVKDRIEKILTSNGDVKDSASKELSQIRKTLRGKQLSVSKRLQSILKNARHDGLVETDAEVSIRDGRPVIPIASALKRKLAGIIHDESSTGKTAYIEPSEVVELNNEIRELEYAEKREIVKILTDFSNDIRPYITELSDLYIFLGRIDFIRSKALFAKRINSIKPVVENKCTLTWVKAVHPLLKFTLQKEKRQVVPLDIQLSPQKHILLISGPNAGGKSVCLKTVGLLQYMLQCGLLIPIDETSKTGIFHKLFIDIGDEQSIENDLSTYSSHLYNMKYFLKNGNDRSLILIDEFGTGTEPMAGGAIAETILDSFNKMGCYGLITTHYTSLKHFASSVDGIENGAMLYDSHKMEPLFHLQIGKPGSSFAFEIARKIGLPVNILENASAKIGKDHIDFDKHLRDIVRDKRYWETKRKRIRKKERSLETLNEQYESALSELNSHRKKLIEQAKKEAEQLISDANRKIEKTIKEIKENQAEKEKTKVARQELHEFKQNIDNEHNIESGNRIKPKIKAPGKIPFERNEKRVQRNGNKAQGGNDEKLSLGDNVIIEGQESVGEIIQMGKKNAIVAFGHIRTSVSLKKLQKVNKQEVKGTNKTLPNIHRKLADKKLHFKSEIDIRGQRVEEALMTIQAFIDEAIMLNINTLRILHGKGNGVLREAIRSYLKSDPAIRSLRDEHVQLGGSGITIAELY